MQFDQSINSLNKAVSHEIEGLISIERDWLSKIGAPCDQLPDVVAEAVAVRVLLQCVPSYICRDLIQNLVSNRIIHQSLQ